MIRKGDTIRLQGRVTVDEVPELYRQSRAWLEGELPAAVDLARVDSADSSAVALLLEWAHWARKRRHKIEFRAPPEGLRTIADLSQVGPLLGWNDQ